MTAADQPTAGVALKSGELHTLIMDLIREDIQRQRPDAFIEDSEEDGFEGDLIIPTGGTPKSAFARINVSDLAEAVLPHVQSRATPASGAVEAALRRIKDLDVRSHHDGYDDGPGGGNFTYKDVVLTEELFPLVDEALAALTSSPKAEGVSYDQGYLASPTAPSFAAPQPLQGGEVTRLIHELATRGADKAGCDGWRAQEMCRQIAALISPARREGEG